ncbi:MAG: phosphatidate cytidylyltransferase [Proteobacteria bacterium]|nr:phosphatidate cytidylyltransferase [Pseudomonadota bacterium]
MAFLDRDLARRLSIVALLPPLVWLVLQQRAVGVVGVALVVHLVAALAQAELYAMTLRDEARVLRAAGVGAGLLAGVAVVWVPRLDLLLPLLIATTMLLAILQLFLHADLQRAALATAVLVFGVLYVPLPLATVALLKRLDQGHLWLVLLLSLTWLADTGAYLVGRAWGRHKLYPRISPGKSIEGAAGAIAAGLAAVAVAKLWYLPLLSWWDVLLIAVPGSVLGMLGDLVESMLKRSVGVKDSGRLLPGHGGLLDRLDALLFAAPYVYYYALFALGQR